MILGVSSGGAAIGCGAVLADAIERGAWWPLAVVFGLLLVMAAATSAVSLCRWQWGK